jgi:hypothetical protein
MFDRPADLKREGAQVGLELLLVRHFYAHLVCPRKTRLLYLAVAPCRFSSESRKAKNSFSSFTLVTVQGIIRDSQLDILAESF